MPFRFIGLILMAPFCAYCSVLTSIGPPLSACDTFVEPHHHPGYRHFFKAQFIWLWDAANINFAVHFCMTWGQTGASWTLSRKYGEHLVNSERDQVVQSTTFSSWKKVLEEFLLFILLIKPAPNKHQGCRVCLVCQDYYYFFRFRVYI